MTTFQVLASESFDFGNPESWQIVGSRGLGRRIRAEFQESSQYLQWATKLMIYSEQHRRSLRCQNLRLMKEEKSLLLSLPERSFKRAKFNRRCQWCSRTLEIRGLMRRNDFGSVVDTVLSEKLQMDSELTLIVAHKREAIKKQQSLLRNDFQESEAPQNVDVACHKCHH